MLLVATLLPAMLASGLVAVGIERVAYRPLRRRSAPRLAYLISAIKTSFFLSYAVQVWRASRPRPTRARCAPKPFSRSNDCGSSTGT